MAFRVTRPTRADLRLTVWFDDRTAPKKATRECKEHGMRSVADILRTVVSE